MRLLYVSHSLPPVGRPLANVGGMQRVAAELHDALHQSAEVDLHALLLRASWRWTHLRIIPFAGHLLHRLPRLVARERVEAVLFSSMVTAGLTLPVIGRLRARGVVTAAIPVGRDVTLPFAPYQRIVPRIFRSLDRIFPISRATARECLLRGAEAERIRVVPCGVEVNRFAGVGTRGEARRRMAEIAEAAGENLTDDVVVLFAVGRHVERKGFQWFIERVMPRLPPQVRFWLAGDGPETARIRDAVARNGLAERVRLIGRVGDDELATLLRGADLFVMPNVSVPGDMEGFGVVMLEAGINGLPIVAAGLEGILDVVQEGVNGRLVASEDAEGFVQAITTLACEPEARERLSASAVAHTRVTFSWPAIVASYLDHLRDARVAAAASAPRTLPPEPVET